MRDPRDDDRADDPPPADSGNADSGAADSEAATSTSSDETDAESRGEPPTATAERATSVAATAGIDDDIIDVPRDLASTVRLQWSIQSAVGAVVGGVVAAGIAFVVGAATTYLAEGIRTAVTVGGVVFVLLVLLGVVRAVLLYRSWSYVVRDESLYLSRGVLTRVRTVVPYVRVQHIDTTRSPLERLLGLSTLVVYTAGSRGADVTIPGLTPERASTLQQRLERLAIESEEADAV